MPIAESKRGPSNPTVPTNSVDSSFAMIARLEDRWLRPSLGVVSVGRISTDHDLSRAQAAWWRRQIASIQRAECADPGDPEGRSYKTEVDGFDLRVTVRLDGTRVARRHKVMRGGDLAIEITILTAHDELLPVLRHMPAIKAERAD